ncbi:hypothetical protein [Candidatus Leptofilum sp.]|uniref:hypothetical protein n=1 Tax=Candidatus Leptofilum sp. TaxID=3241576 RepID=UPI003B5C05A0
MIFLIAVGVILLPILFGGLIAWGSSNFSQVVEQTKEEVENMDKGLNPTITFGHEVKVDASPEEMLKQARLEAARKAASLPRGANMRIGRLGASNLRTAGEALDEDPLTAVRIAMHHGWDGARTGAVTAVAAPAAAPVAAGAAPAGKIKLIPGKDYPVIEITDDMPPDEKRKARIANSKAKSAAMKAAKAAGVPAAAAPVAGAPVAAETPEPAAAQSVNIEPPQLIEMTDDMSPDEKRKARIANSKAKSAFNKALKAAGVDPKQVEIVDGKVVLPGGAPVAAATPAPAAAPAVAPAPAAEPAAAAANIPKPELIEITDDMSPDDKRQARIANSKAKSAYNKALKAAGIDPKSVQ